MHGIDPDLLARCRRREESAFDRLYDAFGPSVWRVCRRMAGNDADAEDLAQDVWVTVWQAVPGFRCESAFSTWLYRIASNTCLQWLRKRKGGRETALDEAATATSENPASIVANKQRVRSLVAAVNSLPPTLTMPLALRVDEGLSYAEIAEALGCSIAAVKMRIRRARAILAGMLEDETDEH